MTIGYVPADIIVRVNTDAVEKEVRTVEGSRLVNTLVWTVLSYGAEISTLRIREERNILVVWL